MSNSSYINDSDFRLTPRDETFSPLEKLKRSEMDGLDASLWEELCIAAAEEELQSNSLLSNKEFQQEVNKYRLLKLTPDKQICYPNKNSLKKSTPKIGLRISIAAAVIVLLVAIPAIIKNTSSDIATPQVATTPDTIKKNQQDQHITNKRIDEAQNNTVIANNTEKTVRPKEATEAFSTPSNAKEEKVEAADLPQERKRASLGLASIEPVNHNAILVESTTENTKQNIIQSGNQDVVLLASVSEIERIEVERPNFFDRLKEKSIVSINRLRGEGTMVVREYDSDGKLTLYAVQSKTLNFEKNYTE